MYDFREEGEAKGEEGEGKGEEEAAPVADTIETTTVEAGCEVTIVEAPFVQTSEPVIHKLEIGDIGEKPDPLDLEELAEEVGRCNL